MKTYTSVNGDTLTADELFELICKRHSQGRPIIFGSNQTIKYGEIVYMAERPFVVLDQTTKEEAESVAKLDGHPVHPRAVYFYHVRAAD